MTLQNPDAPYRVKIPATRVFASINYPYMVADGAYKWVTDPETGEMERVCTGIKAFWGETRLDFIRPATPQEMCDSFLAQGYQWKNTDYYGKGGTWYLEECINEIADLNGSAIVKEMIADILSR